MWTAGRKTWRGRARCSELRYSRFYLCVIEKLPDGDNGNALVGAHSEQMPVAADNVIGSPCPGAFKDAVIVGIIFDDVKDPVRLNHKSDALKPGAYRGGVLG